MTKEKAMANKRILIVDDEAHILELIKFNLESNGFDVVEAETGEEALQKMDETVDLLILDYMLPGMDGMGVLRAVKADKKYKHVPVIMLTAKHEEIDTVLGLELGADDYISKPFRVRELIARIRAVIRRSELVAKAPDQDLVDAGTLVINNTKKTVRLHGQEIKLSLKEYDLLWILASHPGQVFTRDQLLDAVWGYEYIGETRTVDVHVRQLRKKIEDDDKHPEFVLTARGVGYKFKDVE